ncbi:MAG TPA: hypothetical protein VFQ65_28450 [Kofleriaceae bacterium]|nr:hypothetical protein [Kofleriaceae bacterium]
MKALLIASAIALVVVNACGAPQKPSANEDKRAEIIALWTQIRGWRHEAHMDLDPSPMTLNQIRFKTVKDAEKVCVENHKEPAKCGDVCLLASDICDNAEAICTIADELGKDDDFAQGKCTDAKASCHEAKQKCCGCSSESP